MSDKLVNAQGLLQELFTSENKSTCSAKKVGCVIFHRIENNKFEILSTGWNDSIGPCKCTELFEKQNGTWFYKNNGKGMLECEMNAHKKFSEKYEVHAEMMALTNLNKMNLGNHSLQLEILSTYSSCINCTKHLLYNGISRAFYVHSFDDIVDVKRMYTILETPLIQITKASDINANR